MRYYVISTTEESIMDALEQLEKDVNVFCSDGWEPQGGVSVVAKGHWFYCTQAMVKQE